MQGKIKYAMVILLLVVLSPDLIPIGKGCNIKCFSETIITIFQTHVFHDTKDYSSRNLYF